MCIRDRACPEPWTCLASVEKTCAKEVGPVLEFKCYTQLLIEGTCLDEDRINDYITNNIRGDCLLAVCLLYTSRCV